MDIGCGSSLETVEKTVTKCLTPQESKMNIIELRHQDT